MKGFLEKTHKKDGWEQDVACLTMRRKKEDKSAFSPHYHEYIEFLYGVWGVAKVLVGNRVYELRSGDFIIINARELHDVICEAGHADYYVVKFLPKILYSHGQSLSEIRYLLPLWQKDVSFSPLSLKEEIEGSEIDSLIKGIMQEWNTKSFGYELIMKANIMQVFVWMLRNRTPSQVITERSVPKNLENILKNVLEEAENHLADWTAEDAAKFASISYSYFSRSFKLAFGISFSAYLEAMRLREAERLLLTTDKEITDIALTLGFGTTSHFIDRFKKTYELPPNKFRKAMVCEK